MSTTLWYPLPGTGTRWMLTDGTVLDEPAMESSSSGRRVRIAGNKTNSYPAPERSKAAYAEVLRRARTREQWVLCEYLAPSPESDLPPAPRLYMLDNPSCNQWRSVDEKVVYGWYYQCAEFPNVTLSIQIVGEDSRGYYARRSAERMVSLKTQMTPLALADAGTHAHAFEDFGSLTSVPMGSPMPLGSFLNRFYDGTYGTCPITHVAPNDHARLRELLASTKDEVRYYGDDRGQLRDLLCRVRAWDELDEFTLANPAKSTFSGAPGPDVLTMRRTATNVTPAAIENLTVALDAAPLIEEALAKYGELRTVLNRIGLVLGDLRRSDLVRTLTGERAGVLAGVNVQAYSGDSARGAGDPNLRATLTCHDDHKLSLDLLSGMFVVACDRRAISDPEILAITGARWQEATAIASITGQENELLAAARVVAHQCQQEQTARLFQAQPNHTT